MPHFSLARFWIVAVLAVLVVGVPPTVALARPKTVKAGPTVIGFSGMLHPFTTHHSGAVAMVVETLRQRGVAAEVYPPGAEDSLGEQIAANPPAGPLILVGYSMGAGAATKLAARLEQAGIPVARLVIIEAWNPTPLASNIVHAVHFYATRMASPLQPGPGFRGRLESFDLNSRVPGIEAEGHVSMSQMAAVQDLVVSEVMRGASGPPASGKAPAAR